MMRLTISICATKQYSYALGSQATAVQSCINEYRRLRGDLDVCIILVSDGNEQMVKLENWYKNNLLCDVIHIKKDFSDDHKNYKLKAQHLIATMRNLAFNKAKTINPDYHWCIDSDVIPKANFLHLAVDVSTLDGGYYDVCAAPYPSQGASGPFLCGFGTPTRNILDNVYPDEKKVPPKILKRIKSREAEANKAELILKNKAKKSLHEKAFKRLGVLRGILRRWNKFIDKRCPPNGNVFALNSKGYRRRGWADAAYNSALAKGNMALYSDWCGLGCNLLTRKALNLCDFSGYQNRGTEDLFIVFWRWRPNGIKIACLPHSLADHVCRVKNPKGEVVYKHVVAYYETEGECVGHARQRVQDFIEHSIL